MRPPRSHLDFFFYFARAMSTVVTGRMKMAGRVLQTPGFQHALLAFRRALTARERSRGPRRHALETGELKLLPAVLTLSAII